MSAGVSDLTVCPICLDLFVDPRSLPCIHTFCFRCIVTHCCQQHPGDEAQCPVCRRKFNVPPGGVKDLPHNFIVQCLVDMPAATRTIADEPCQVCSEKRGGAAAAAVDDHRVPPATMFCADCRWKLCAACGAQHRRQMGDSHDVRPRDEAPDVESVQPRGSCCCRRHAGRQVELFCLTCTTNICVLCHAVDHQHHQCLEIDRAAADIRVRMEAGMEQAAEHERVVRARKERLLNDQENFVRQVVDVEESIKTKAEDLKRLVDRHADELLRELQTLKEHTTKMVAAGKEELDLVLLSLETFSSYTRELLSRGRPCDLTGAGRDLRARVDDLSWSADDGISGELRMPLVVLVSSDIEEILLSGNRGRNLIGTVRCKFMSEPQMLHVIGANDQPIAGMTSLNNQLYLVRDGKIDHVEVYDADTYALKKRIAVKHLQWGRITDIASCQHHRCIYASDQTNACIHRLDIRDKVAKWPAADQPLTLSVTPGRTLLATSASARCLREFSTTGSVVRVVKLPDAFSNPHHAIQLADDRYLLCHGWSDDSVSRVCLIAGDGLLLRSYGGAPGAETGRMDVPRYLAVDADGFVYVADYKNERVLLLDPSLNDVHEVISLPEQHAYRLHLDAVGRRLFLSVVEFCSGKPQGSLSMYDVGKLL